MTTPGVFYKWFQSFQRAVVTILFYLFTVLISVSFYFIRPASDSLDNRSMELKFKEPELAPERNPRDYTVHFPQDKSHDPAVTKSYKTSGPVIPDTIRYQ